MTDELKVLLRAGADSVTNSVTVPPPDLARVIRGGRRRLIVRRGLAVVAAAAAAGVLALWSADFDGFGRRDTAPIHQPEQDSVERALIVVPAPEGAPAPGPAEAVADARAITFAFHGLANTVGYHYDYKEFARLDGAWSVKFLSGPDVDDIRAEVRASRSDIARARNELDETRDDAVAVADRLARARKRDNQERVSTLRNRLDAIMSETAELQVGLEHAVSHLREARTQLEAAGEKGGAEPIEVIVERQDQWLTVVSVSGPFDEEETERIRDYRELAADVDVHGVDWYNVELVGPGVVDDVSGVKAFGFWTGPIPSSYEEECPLILRARSGTVVYRQPDRDSPGSVAWKAPSNEDGRDGWSRGSGIDVEKLGEIQGLVPDFECYMTE